MESNKHIKYKRKLVFPAPQLIGFIFTHRFTPVERWNEELKKSEFTGGCLLDLQLCFFWPSAYVQIHNNPDEPKLSFTEYIKKVELIKSMCQDMVEHLGLGKGVMVRRNFLNDETINDGFGATLFMTADPDMGSNYCIFEIASCFKKYRYGTTPSVLRKYLKDLIIFIEQIEEDLVVVKSKLDQALVEKENNGK